MAEPTRSLFEKHSRLRGQLAHALRVDAEVNRIVEGLQRLDAPTASELPREVDSISVAPPVALTLVWIPEDIPVTVHLYCNGRAVPGSNLLLQGGMMSFPVPRELVKVGEKNEIILALRFLSGGWKYKLLATIDGVTAVLDEGKDADPSNPKDDRFTKTLDLMVAA